MQRKQSPIGGYGGGITQTPNQPLPRYGRTPRSGLPGRYSDTLVPPPASSSVSRVSSRAMFSESELRKVRSGLSTSTASFINERTGKPIIPPPGRSIPKLTLTDLSSSLVPFVEGQTQGSDRGQYSLANKRVNQAMQEVTAMSDDMLKSFDEAIKIPDVSAVNSKIRRIRDGMAPLPEFKSLSTSRLGEDPPMPSSRRVQSTVRPGRRMAPARVSPKNEEEQIRGLMDQLKNKYLNDMESQLGLAIQGKSSQSLPQHGENGRNHKIEPMVPRPSTSATEIASTIDKVVRDWAKESQKISTAKSMKNLSSSTKTQSRSQLGRQTKANEMQLASGKLVGNSNAWQENGRMEGNEIGRSFNAPEPNKNLQTISSAFRKMLDPFSKQNVDDLINIPEDEKVDMEHEERKKAHAAVLKNVVVSSGGDGETAKGSRSKRKQKEKPSKEVVSK